MIINPATAQEVERSSRETRSAVTGDRVRATFTHRRLVMEGRDVKRDTQTVTLVGTLDSLTADILFVSPDPASGEFSKVPLADLTRLEVSAGRADNTLKGMAIGTGVGAGVGFLIGVLACGDSCEAEPWQAGLILGAMGGGIGLVMGWVVGSTGSERWELVPLANVHTGVGGAMLTIRASF